MEVEVVLKILVLVVGFYMAWNIGANDVSNAMGTSVGSGALTLKRAVVLAAILEFAGAYFVGGNVSETMQKGLIDTEMFTSEPMLLVLGMCAALLGTSIWLQVASYFGWPVSTTHAIVGAILGFGALIGGSEAIQWEQTGSIAASWVISPVLSGLVSFLFFNFVQRKILFAMNPMEATKKLIPFLIFIVFGTFTLSLIFNGLDNLNFTINFAGAFAIATLVGLFTSLIAYILVRRIPTPESCPLPLSHHLPQNVVSLDKAMKHLQRVRVATYDETHSKVSQILTEVKTLSQRLRDEGSFSARTSEYSVVEKLFAYLQILSACFVAFAHGANDVANAIGPVAAVLDIIKNGVISDTAVIPSYLLIFGGLGIVIGLATWGWRVIMTIGKKITELTPTRGFCAEFGAAVTILIASKLGLPVSTTHCLVGAVLGVGLARGIKAINLNMVRDIILSWIVTIPASAAMSIGIYFVLKAIFI
ncbi:MAG TPA: inorganic phosphate transporter [Rhabdochlamydiaceae bacterium]|nr:inorganic phosphate transporter [Rhabdochlamydiaceae bacterium]